MTTTINGKQAFPEFDVSKMFSAFSVPGFNVAALVAAQRKNIEAITQANQLAIEAVQAVARRQAEITREALDEAPELFRELSQPGAPQEKLAKNAELAKTSFEKGLTSARELTELFAKANTEAFNVIAKRMTESFSEMRDMASTKAA